MVVGHESEFQIHYYEKSILQYTFEEIAQDLQTN